MKCPTRSPLSACRSYPAPPTPYTTLTALITHTGWEKNMGIGDEYQGLGAKPPKKK